MPLKFVQQDITKMQVDAIVNAANPQLKNYARSRGGGVCGAVFRAAGQNRMQKACDRLGGCEVGGAVVTPGFALPAKHVIHAVGPVYQAGGMEEHILLYHSYVSAFLRAQECGAQSVAFPLISAGIFGYPAFEALRIAVTAIRDFSADMEVFLCILDDALFRQAVSMELEELEWEEVGSAHGKWLLELRRADDRFEFQKVKSPFSEEEIRIMESLPFEEALAYRKKLWEKL